MFSQMKIQPINASDPEESINTDQSKPVVTKSRFKRLLERQFPSILRTTSSEKAGIAIAKEPQLKKDGSGEFDTSPVCLAKMVRNYIEENTEKTISVKCTRNRCNCFFGNCDDSSDDGFDKFTCFGDLNSALSGEACEILKSLVPCRSVWERILLAEVTRIVEKDKIYKRKDDACRKIVSDSLFDLGYDVSICKSRWENSSSFPAGEYEYIDVIVEGERLLIDIDFRSEFQMARSTKAYKTILQNLPYIFVGKPDRLLRIISVVTDAVQQSIKKKGMHLPPWRRAEYVQAKWLSPYTRMPPLPYYSIETPIKSTKNQLVSRPSEFGVGAGEPVPLVVNEWKPPAVNPKKNSPAGGKIVTGLASIMEDDP